MTGFRGEGFRMPKGWPLQAWQVTFRNGDGEVTYDVLHEDGSRAEDIVQPFLKWYDREYGDNPDALPDAAERASLAKRVDGTLAGGGAISQHELTIGSLSVRAREIIQTGSET